MFREICTNLFILIFIKSLLLKWRLLILKKNFYHDFPEDIQKDIEVQKDLDDKFSTKNLLYLEKKSRDKFLNLLGNIESASSFMSFVDLKGSFYKNLYLFFPFNHFFVDESNLGIKVENTYFDAGKYY